MLFSTLVIVMTAIVLALISAWFSPALRRWMEEPKYRMLRQEDRFDARHIGSQGQRRDTTSSVKSHSEPAEPPSRNKS
jgi:hypothetical protein